MIFVGDISLPFEGAISLSKFPDNLTNKYWFGNLEGGISCSIKKDKNGVFNDLKALQELIKKFHFKGFALANNHIFDIGSYRETTDFLEQMNLSFCGIGKDIKEAGKPLLLQEDNNQIVILNFGWEVIQCEIASNEKAGVNPIIKNHVLNLLRDTLSLYPKAKIIPYMHWGYELESEPQPFERELAKKMIEWGAAGVIGSHSHRVGGFEVYNGKPIVYSLGNWLFKQNYYGKKRYFPDFCNLELAFEWNFKTDEYQFHFFEYDRKQSQLIYLRTEGKESKTMSLHTPFNELTDIEYKKWYKHNHYHKKKGLPIYYFDDSQSKVRCKNRWNKIRDILLKIVFKKGK